jgi:hypothetical protein
LKSSRLNERPGIQPNVILCDLPSPCCRGPGIGNAGRHSEGRCAVTALDTCRAFLGRCGWHDLDQAHPRRFRTFSPLGDIKDHPISFAEAAEPRSFKGRDVHEHIFAAAIPSDEAVAFLDIEPLHRSGFFDQPVGSWSARCRASVMRLPWRDRSSGARTDAQHLGDMRPRVAGTNADFRVSPGCTALIPLRASTVAWRKPSPDPSVSATNPNPLPGLNHLTTPPTGGPQGASALSHRDRCLRYRLPELRVVAEKEASPAPFQPLQSVKRGQHRPGFELPSQILDELTGEPLALQCL